MIYKFLLFSCIILCAQSAFGFDLAGKFSNYTCMKSIGKDLAIIRAYHSYGAVDIDAPNNIKLSNQAGLLTDVYLFPCRGKNATLQVNQMIDYLANQTFYKKQEVKKIEVARGLRAGYTTEQEYEVIINENQFYNDYSASIYDSQYGTIWLDIETNPSSGCSWNIGKPEQNCAFIAQLIQAIQARGRAAGIYASAYMWTQILGDKNACKNFTNTPLWYAHYDNDPSFNDWTTSQFGGWTSPTLKQYAGDSVQCDSSVDLNYF